MCRRRFEESRLPPRSRTNLVPYPVNMTKRGADKFGRADYAFECTGDVKVRRPPD